MKCTVCNHPQLHDIDQALLAENATFAALGKKYGLSISSLFRHKRHLQGKMAQAEKRLQNHFRQETLFHYNELLETTRRLIGTAVAAGDTRQALQAIREGTRILNFMTKLEVTFDADLVYRILASPQWVSQDSLLPADPGIIFGNRQAQADDLFFPCPEIPPDPQLDTWDEEDATAADLAKASILETQNSELETPLPAKITQELLQQILTQLDHRPANQPKTENRKLATAKPPKNQRDMSAKLARKPASRIQNNQQNKEDRRCEKNIRKNSPLGRESTRRAASAQAPPAVCPSCSPPVNFTPELPPETGPRPPDAHRPQHQTQPPVAPDPFLQAFPYLVCTTSCRELHRPPSTPVPATTISPEHLRQSFPEDNQLKNNSASGELMVASRPDPAPCQEPGEIIPLNISERCYRGIY